jgi:hypothetical protein
MRCQEPTTETTADPDKGTPRANAGRKGMELAAESASLPKGPRKRQDRTVR